MRSKVSWFCDKVIEAGWLAALVVVPLFFNIFSQRVFEPDKLSILRSIALVMSAAWLVRIVEDRRTGRPREKVEASSFWQRLTSTPLVLPALLTVLIYLISTLLSVVPGVSLWGSYQRLQGTYTTLSYIVIFFLMLEGLRTKRQLNRVITVTILVSFPIALYGLVQHFGLDPLPWGGNVTTRVASNMGNAIFVAAYLIMIVPLTLSRLLENWKETVGEFETADGVLGAVAFVFLAGGLIGAMLLSRNGSAGWLSWVILVAGAVLSAGVYLFRPIEKRPRVLAISLPLTFAFLVGFVWILEIPFPPVEPRYFSWGLLASLVFLVAMVPFAYYLRKPISRLLLLAAYFVILIAQLITIFYTQSRGPLLGLLGGIIFYFAVLGLIRRRNWVSWLVGGTALLGLVFLLIFNTVETPLVNSLREVPYIGRLGKLLQTERGTGKVRVLIWKGVTDMITWHPPLEAPGEDGWTDPFNVIRPIIGYGPESMYLAYNRFYPPELAHFEKRNASPDRSHNETFDSLVISGVVGFAIYMYLFVSVFYYGLKWLGLVRNRRQAWIFVGLWIAGGIAGALATWALLGLPYIGVGIPLGVMGGLVIYLLGQLITSTRRSLAARRDNGELPQPVATGSSYAALSFDAWILALLAAIVAHFVEIHLGIAIAATRTYFWVYAAMMVVIGTRLATLPAASPDGVKLAAGLPAPQQASQGSSHRRRRRREATQATGARVRTTEERDWLGAVLLLSIVAILILGTMFFDYTTAQQDTSGLLATIWNSLTQSQGDTSAVMLVLFLSTWGMIGLLGLGDLATRRESEGKEALDWLIAWGIFASVSLFGTLLFAIVHAMRLATAAFLPAGATNPLPDTITAYYLFVFLIVAAMAAALTFVFHRPTSPRRATGDLGGLGVAALALALLVVAGLIIAITNISIIRADIVYKQGLSAENAGYWDGAIRFYEQTVDMAKDEDFYYLFLGRALMEKARTVTGQERQALLQRSEQALSTARDIAPLNTDHSANLARLYRTWGGLSQGDTQTELLNRALDYYADAISLSPHNARLFNEWGQTYLVLGELDRALEMYQKSLALDSEYVQTYLLLGEYYVQQKDWEAAVEAYQQAVQVKSNSADAHSALGYVYSQVGDMQSALQAYQRAVELRPRNFNDRKNLALIYQELGLKDDAIREATQALELAPANQKSAMQSFLAQLGQPTSTLSPEDTQKIQELLDEGQQQMAAEEWQAAEQTYRQVLELDLQNALAHSALAFVYTKLGQIDQAITENLAVLELLPGDYNSYKNLAILYRQKGDLNKSLAVAKQALTYAPEAEKPALQAFIQEVEQEQGGSSSPTQPLQRAGDLPPSERDAMYTSPPPMTIDPAKAYQATIVTKKGNIIVDLAAADAPKTINNLVFLANEGFFDNLTFHRVENQPGFSLIQGGDPLGTGRGGPGYTVPAEIGLPHDEGAIAMARLPDQVNPEQASSGSQFYICLVPIHQLDGAYTVFGYVVEGLDVAQTIEAGDEILTIVITEE